MFILKIFLIFSILELIQCRYLIIEVPDIENFSGRIKRDLAVKKNSDSDYSITAEKDIYKDGTQSLTASGGLYGLKPGDYGYRSTGLGLNYANEKGHNLEMSAQHSPSSDQLTAEGKLVLLNTEEHKLDATGHYNRESTRDGKLTNFGGTLDYRHKNGHSASVTGQHDSNIGDKLSATGRVKLLDTDVHKLDGNAYFTRNIPRDPFKSSSNSYGANLDYLNRISQLAYSSSVQGLSPARWTDDLKYHTGGDWMRKAEDRAWWRFLEEAYILQWRDVIVLMTYSITQTFGNGNSASLSARHLSDFGDQVAAAGKLNLYSNENHNLDATGSISRTFPSSPYIPNYNNYGANLDYTYRDTVGASLGMKHNDLFDKTDYSALGNLNLYRDENSSFDVNAGLSKTYSPTYNSDWTPSIGFGYRIEY